LKLAETFNDVVALDFDLACTVRLLYFDNEQETRKIEALWGGKAAKPQAGIPKELMFDGSEERTW
jgi:hypothetical protein